MEDTKQTRPSKSTEQCSCEFTETGAEWAGLAWLSTSPLSVYYEFQTSGSLSLVQCDHFCFVLFYVVIFTLKSLFLVR